MSNLGITGGNPANAQSMRGSKEAIGFGLGGVSLMNGNSGQSFLTSVGKPYFTGNTLVKPLAAIGVSTRSWKTKQ